MLESLSTNLYVGDGGAAGEGGDLRTDCKTSGMFGEAGGLRDGGRLLLTQCRGIGSSIVEARSVSAPMD